MEDITRMKRRFLTALATVIKKDTTTIIRKHPKTKTLRTAIKQDLNPDLKPLDYAIWGVLQNKTIATSHQNVGSLKTAIEEEWNKMSEEFILKPCKSFRKQIDTIIEKKKKKKKNEAI